MLAGQSYVVYLPSSDQPDELLVLSMVHLGVRHRYQAAGLSSLVLG